MSREEEEHIAFLNAQVEKLKRTNEELKRKTEEKQAERRTRARTEEPAEEKVDADDLERLLQGGSANSQFSLEDIQFDAVQQEAPELDVVEQVQEQAQEQDPAQDPAQAAAHEVDEEEAAQFFERARAALEKTPSDAFAEFKVATLNIASPLARLLKSKGNKKAPITLLVVPDEDGAPCPTTLINDEKDAVLWLNPKKQVRIVTLRDLILDLESTNYSDLTAKLVYYKRREVVGIATLAATAAERAHRDRIAATLSQLMLQRNFQLEVSHAVAETPAELLSFMIEKC